MVPIFKTLTINLLKTIIIAFVILFSIVYVYVDKYDIWSHMLVVLVSLGMSLSLVGVYFNMFKQVRESKILSALSFFLIPMFSITELAPFGIPFILVQLYYYLKFHKIEKLFGMKVNIIRNIFLVLLALGLAVLFIYKKQTHPSNSKFYQGYVFNDKDEPLKDVKVMFDSDSTIYTLTDTLGYFKLDKEPNFYNNLVLEKEGYFGDTIHPVSTHFERGPEYHFLRIPGSVVLIEKPKSLISSEFLYLIKKFDLAGYAVDTSKIDCPTINVENYILFRIPLEEHYIYSMRYFETFYAFKPPVIVGTNSVDSSQLNPVDSFNITPFLKVKSITRFDYKQRVPLKTDHGNWYQRGIIDELVFETNDEAQLAYNEINEKAYQSIFFKTGGLVCLKDNKIFIGTSDVNGFVWQQRLIFGPFTEEISADEYSMY